MTIKEHYTRELQALRKLGAEFSKNNPGLSSFLDRKGQDPDVERLLEGFSFLVARLRQYMDEELPEVSHSIMQLMWPNYLKSIPSYSILKYDPATTSQKSILIPKGEEVIGLEPELGVECRFKTCYNVDVYPIDIINANYYIDGTKGVVELTLKTVSEISLDLISFDKLRIFIGGHEHLSDTLLMFFLEFVEDIELILKKDKPTIKLGRDSISPVGLSEDEHILPLPKNVFSGYMLLQEYFCYRQKYHFIDIKGFEKLKSFDEDLLAGSDSFVIRIKFSEKIKMGETLSVDNFNLYCTPIVNIFETEAEPIKKDLQEEYEVRPSGISYQFCEVYSVKSVHGWDNRTNKYYKYLSFESFEHTKEDVEYYNERVVLSADETRTKTFLRFRPKDIASDGNFEDRITVSVDILATNRDIPSHLDIGSITTSGGKSKATNIPFKNITTPTKSYTPPIRGDLLWRVISNMSLNYLSLENIETLRSILETYDFIGANDVLQFKQTQNMLQGIEDIKYSTSDIIYKGLPIRGTNIKLALNSKKFSTIGEAYMLCNILNEFFSLYSSINTYHKLEVIIDQKAHFVWKPRMGVKTL